MYLWTPSHLDHAHLERAQPEPGRRGRADQPKRACGSSPELDTDLPSGPVRLREPQSLVTDAHPWSIIIDGVEERIRAPACDSRPVLVDDQAR